MEKTQLCRDAREMPDINRSYRGRLYISQAASRTYYLQVNSECNWHITVTG